MSDLNVWVGVGRLTRDAELKYTNSGTAVLHMSIAVNRSIPPSGGVGDWKNEAMFIDVTLWGKAAITKAPQLVKGKLIGLQGRLDMDRWEQDGQVRTKHYITAETIQVILRGGETGDGQARSPRAAAASPAPSSPAAADDYADDIPF